MKKRNSTHRVSIATRANGLVALELQKRGPKFSLTKNKKKENSKKICRQKTDDFFCLQNEYTIIQSNV